ncbi:hypothetical protein ACFLVE_00630 [Chloroflexota bacterium]
MVSTAVPALAQNEEDETLAPNRVRMESLVILAPRMAPVGEEVSMTVFQRSTQGKVKDAAVWALTRQNADALKEQLTQLKEEGNGSLQEVDWESLVSPIGIFLGTTNGSGRLEYTFTEGGRYQLIAIKGGYFPGRTGIAIRNIRDALAIMAPRMAPVSEEVGMTVFQRSTQDAVKDAAVWALTRENADALKEKLAQLKEEGNGSTSDVDWESLVSPIGIFLGTTNGSGQLQYTFTEGGRYHLVTIKGGYAPGHAGINIRDNCE